MKNKIKLSSLLFLLGIFIISGCKDRTEVTAPEQIQQKSGKADFTRFVTIGNSLTAGVQSNSLFETAQKYSYGNQIANQVNASFEQPIVAEPGTPGRLEVVSLNPFQTYITKTSGAPLNLQYQAPYNNLGISGAFTYDVLNAQDSSSCYTAKYFNKPNPMFNLVLRGIGTQFQQAKMLHPTFVSLWIGNNDVLGYATSGGKIPITPSQQFAGMYSQILDSLASICPDGVVANIPNVSVLPFLTTVGPQIAIGTPWPTVKLLGVQGLVYQSTGSSPIGLADSAALLTGKVLLTLDGSEYAQLLGKPTGKYYRDNGMNIPAGVDTTKPFGFTPENPWPNYLILDQTEISNIQTAVSEYNNAINAAATAHYYGVVDINAALNQIRAADFNGGTVVNGVKFTTRYVEGGLFSLDGVHPTSQGYGIITNAFITVINQKYEANIPAINISTIPGSIKIHSLGKALNAIVPAKAFTNSFMF